MGYNLEVLKDFKCLGSECPDSCCQGRWLIEIEDDVYQKWKSISEVGMRETLLASVQLAENGSRVCKREQGKCVHLDGQSLCRIQIEYGEGFMPEVCVQYPRLKIRDHDFELNSAKLSCPEIARLALLEKTDELIFEAIRKTPVEGGFLYSTSDQLLNIFDDLISDVMTQPKMWLTNRIYYIVKILSDLGEEKEAQVDAFSYLENEQKQIRKKLSEVSLATKNGKIKVDQQTAGTIWYSIYTLCKNSDYFSGQSWFDESELVTLLKSVEPSDLSGEISRVIYQHISQYSRSARPILRSSYADILDRYIIISFRNKGFPWRPAQGNVAATFLNCMVPFFMIQLLCWVRLQHTGYLQREFIIDMIWQIERDLGQTDIVYNHIARNPHMLQLSGYSGFFSDLC